MKHIFEAVASLLLLAILAHSRIYHRTHSVRPAGSYTFNVIKFVKNCGGAGQIDEFRDEECDDVGSVCRYKGDGFPHEQELDYVPSKDIQQIGFRGYALPDTLLLNVTIPDSGVKAGKKYTLRNEYILEEDQKGTKAEGKLEIYDTKDGVADACIQAKFEIV